MLSFMPRSEIEANVGVAGDMLEELAVLLQALQLLRCHTHFIGLCLIGFGKLHDTVGFREGQRAQ